MGRGIRHSYRFVRQALQGVKRQVDEYLVEESSLIAPGWQIDTFYNEVDQVALRTEKLEAKLNKLRQQNVQRR